MSDCDIIVIGAGHAGLEACLASARLSKDTVLITQNLNAIAKMSCNPAIGGLAKGNIVREIDALGGQMGILADDALVQFRMLNKSRGTAVQAPRAQEDKYRYSLLAKKVVDEQKGLRALEDTVVDFLVEGKKVIGVKTASGVAITARAVVLTTGTFMQGKTFVGDEIKSEGRIGESAALGLGDAMRTLGFNMGRLKTGTPARIARESIDYSKCDVQKGDEEIIPFSFSHTDPSLYKNIEDCYITFTNEKTHDIIRQNISRSPLYSGLIVGRGPRYCPSIEDKVMRFPERDRHQIFIEPEGEDSDEMYLNGLSSSLPRDVQERFIRTLAPLENCNINKFAYAVEYDYSDPQDLKQTLESKLYENLFIAGQTNGTSGYEEAAAQGLIAGINAVLKLEKRPALILRRDESYIGVLIDDLVTLGTKEPYRMFTSRAEYRLLLRHDNSDRRLSGYGVDIGLLNGRRKELFYKKLDDIKEISSLLKSKRQSGKSAEDILRQSDKSIDDVMNIVPELSGYDRQVLDTVRNDIKYSGYLKRQEVSINQFKRLESAKIREDFDYRRVLGLSSESVEKLEKVRPTTLRQAGQISGIRQSDLALLSLYISHKIKE